MKKEFIQFLNVLYVQKYLIQKKICIITNKICTFLPSDHHLHHLHLLVQVEVVEVVEVVQVVEVAIKLLLLRDGEGEDKACIVHRQPAAA
jgi:hypothetical protein